MVFVKISMQTFHMFYFAGLFQGMSMKRWEYITFVIFSFLVCVCLLTYHFAVCQEKVMKIIKLLLSISAFQWEKWFEEPVIHQLAKDSLSWIYMKRGRECFKYFKLQKIHFSMTNIGGGWVSQESNML